MILDFDEDLTRVQSKTNKTIDRLCKLQNTTTRRALITIYKAFAGTHLDYGNVIYDQGFNELFHQKLEKIKHDACTAITGTIYGTSKEKIYQEFGLESLKSRR